jgi:hypothetical protein
MVWELFQQIERGTELVAWRQGRSLPYAEGISFWALGEMVKAEAGILDTDAAEEAAAKLARTVSALGVEPADADWIERHLRPLVGLEAASELHGDRSGEAFAAWRRFFESLADRRPLVLVFEDLHWADDRLLDFVDHLIEWATGVPLLIVGTSRPELLSRRPGWAGGKPNALTISLSPLSDAETSRLVATLVEQAVIPSQLHEAVLARAEGNPLYAEEFARLMAERGALADLPETVQGIVAARLDALPREEKQLLQDAAVMGKVFWSGALAGMSGRDRAEVEARLHTLERKEFVRRDRRSSVAAETEYAFRHIVVRDVAYGQIPRADRGERHVRAATWIESLGRPADHAELLAQHYLAALELARAAGRPIDPFAERARRAFRDAAERALGLNAFAAVVRYYAQALEMTPSDDPERPTYLLQYAEALWFAEERGDDVLAEAEAGFRAAGNLEGAAEAAVARAALAWDAGDDVLRKEHASRAAALVDDLPPSHAKAYVLSRLSRFHMLAAESDDAVRRGRQALALAEDLGLDEVRAYTLNNVGAARTNAGDLDGGIADLEAAIEIADAIKSPDVARAMNNLGVTLYGVGETRRARALWRGALARAEELGHGPVARFQRGNALWIAYDEGRWDDAQAGLDEFIGEVELAGGYSTESTFRLTRGHIRYGRGDIAGAIEDVEKALAATPGQDPLARVPALALAAWVRHRTGRIEDAHRMLDELVGIIGPSLSGDAAVVDCLIVLDALGRPADHARVAAMVLPGGWADLYAATVAGRFEDAAEIALRLESLPTSALLRWRAAERLIAGGQVEQARAQLDKAAEFWRSVGATQHLREAEELLARAVTTSPASS